MIAMSDLNKELSSFARAIVRAEAVSTEIHSAYPNYSCDTAIEVYRNNYRGNLHDALAGAYPVIVQLVGDDFFRFLAKKYIECNQSTSASLHDYGAGMADFLAGFEPVWQLPYLPDMAKLEWACHVAYYAEDQLALSFESLAQIPAERYADLVLHTACQLIRSKFPVAAIWQAHQSAMSEDFHLDLLEQPGIFLVSRRDCFIEVSELIASDADWLQRIQNGEVLGVATMATIELYPDFDLQAVLHKLIVSEALTGFSLEKA
jgi:hypothetical protein